jgi:23S rRNA pseudouridine1911/1915/1917 synthase
MSRVPFYANDDSDMRCMVAVYRSIFSYFLRKKLSWQEADEFVGFRDGHAAWTVLALTKMARMGFDIRMIEPFNYRTYTRRGRTYLKETYPDEQLDWLLAHSNILDIKPYIPEFLKTVRWENRRATLEDIDTMLAEKRLVFVALNGRKLNGREGYSNHAVLITGRSDDSYILHDPGLPPKPDRRVWRDKLWDAMGGDAHMSEVTGFKLGNGIGGRLDQYVVLQKPRLSRAYTVKLIADSRVLVNGSPSKPGYKVRPDDSITIDYDEAELEQIPAIDLPVLYEDKTAVVINKPAGVLTHSKGGISTEGTVATWLRSRIYDVLNGERGGIVHRLDRATSGVMICAKTPAALSWLQKQFAARSVTKTYYAVVSGHMPHDHALIDMPIARNPKRPQTFRAANGGKPAVTEYWVRGLNDHVSLLELRPQTGRTHQLRVHLARVGHPIVGDVLYGGQTADRMYLHATGLELTLPNHTRQIFTAPVPPSFQAMLQT